jgi:hypothetical protein
MSFAPKNQSKRRPTRRATRTMKKKTMERKEARRNGRGAVGSNAHNEQV